MGRHTRSKRNRRRGGPGPSASSGGGWGSGAGRCWRLGWARWAGAGGACGWVDVIVDPIINALSGFDPTLGADVSTVVGDFTSSSDSWWRTLVGWIRRWGRPAAGPAWCPIPVGGVGLRAAAGSGADSWGTVSEDREQDWITSQFGHPGG